MNLEVSFWVFVVLTVMHPIGDFLTPIRQFGRGWKQFFVSEWFLVLNPLHFIWDKWSPLRRHHLYLEPIFLAKDIVEPKPQFKTNKQIVAYIKITNPIFWRWLALDQLYHVLSNLLLAWVIGVVV